MAKREKKFWIKERHNPQIGVYYVACGQLSKAEAMGKTKTLYGTNLMHSFDTSAAYEARLAELYKSGAHVQS